MKIVFSFRPNNLLGPLDVSVEMVDMLARHHAVLPSVQDECGTGDVGQLGGADVAAGRVVVPVSLAPG